MTSGYYKGENPMNILLFNIILVNCDIISRLYLNGSQQSVLYSFFPDVSPGYKITEVRHNIIYLPVSHSGTISHLRI